MRTTIARLSLLHLSREINVKALNVPCARWIVSDSSQKTHFGFQTVTEEEKAEKVKQVFSNVASKYDLMNDVMSGGIHRLWKCYFIRKLDPHPGTKLLDVAGGTGDIAFRFLDYIKENNQGDVEGASVTVCDINAEMLSEGRKRAQIKGLDDPSIIQWVEGDAMKLPFESASFDAYTIAFGIRNVVDIRKALKEAHRVLRPGGVFHCLEFSHVTNPFLSEVYDWYSFNIIPVQGEVFAGDWKSYQYLVESIRKFPDQEDFKEMIEESGFTLVHYENLLQGVASIHTGYKSD